MATYNTYDEDGNVAGRFACYLLDGPDGQELYLYKGRWHLASLSGEREIKIGEARGLATEWGHSLPVTRKIFWYWVGLSINWSFSVIWYWPVTSRTPHRSTQQYLVEV